MYKAMKSLDLSQFYGTLFTIRTMFEEAVHFGHRCSHLHRKMVPYVYGHKADIHIIDLRKTAEMLEIALNAIRFAATKNGRILMVGTKTQASQIIADSAKRCGQYYVNKRWLGGMLTNWSTVSASIKRLKEYENLLKDPKSNLIKKERLSLDKKRIKLETVLGGVRNMGGVPDMVVIVGLRENHIAAQEARILNIPMVAVVDTNCDPTHITYPIPGNDDSRRSINFYCNLISEAILMGISDSLQRSKQPKDELVFEAGKTSEAVQ